ncbi:MAG: hypothetical protein N4A54_07600 [Peptostreptococcaceae bacterium]|jgi:hypothetical protein|nr:hypothetical protein [Peptostreptococcaceae bacterium]
MTNLDKLEQLLLKKYVLIDADLTEFNISSFFNTVDFSFYSSSYNDNLKKQGIKYDSKIHDFLVSCKFENCFTVNLSHDKNYGDDKYNKQKFNKYFIQSFEITKDDDDFYTFKMSGWPLVEACIVCRNIILTSNENGINEIVYNAKNELKKEE